MNVLHSKGSTAFQIIGDSGAAQHCRGQDDIPKDERHKIRKADIPLIFVTANGEVPCNKVIATDIPQLGITRDMYVMKDSPSVISIGRLVIDDGYDFIWKHSDHQAVLIPPQRRTPQPLERHVHPHVGCSTILRHQRIEGRFAFIGTGFSTVNRIC